MMTLEEFIAKYGDSRINVEPTEEQMNNDLEDDADINCDFDLCASCKFTKACELFYELEDERIITKCNLYEGEENDD